MALTGFPPPNQEQILEIMKECNCNERQARKALKLHNSDTERAKCHQHKRNEYKSKKSSGAYKPVKRVLQAATNIELSTDEQEQEQEQEQEPNVGQKDKDDNELDLGECRSMLNNEAVEHIGPEQVDTSPVAKATMSDTSLYHTKARTKRFLDIYTKRKKESPVCDADVASTQHQDGGSPDEHEVPHEWDFVLPTLLHPEVRTPEDEARYPFDPKFLMENIQHGASPRFVQNYLANYDEKLIRRQLNCEIEGFPAIFYVVARNDEEMLRDWVRFGGDVNAFHEASKTPLVAFAIVHSETIHKDMTSVVATLLGLGAAPEVIPIEFYTPYFDDLPIDGPETIDESNPATAWCTIAARKRLGRTFNLSQRYYLWRATKLQKLSARARQVVVRKKTEAILEIPYFLIGQTIAAGRVLRKLLNHVATPSTRPLVLTFAGPSGHGKTELARHMGHLLSLDLEVVDCTIVNREMELFGPRHPFVNAEKGTPLNNFLVEHADQRCIVFMDEFEKTTSDIHQALLLPFDNGEYQDRRTLSKVKCSKTIWIVATNALDKEIISFCDRNEDIMTGEEATKEMLGKQLSRELKKAFLDRFGAPITGRMTDFIPFVPFSLGEQAVVAHKFLRELSRKVQESVNLSEGRDERLVGNVTMHVKHDASVCTTLAEAEYSRDLGARSLNGAVKEVEDKLLEVYFAQRDEIVEGGKILEVVVDAHAGEVLVTPA